MEEPLKKANDVVRRILKCIKDECSGVISERSYKLLWNCFKWVYVIGYENGYKAASSINGCKPVEQMKDGEVVGEFESITKAADAVGRNKSSIWKAITKFDRATCAGYNWRYKNY